MSEQFTESLTPRMAAQRNEQNLAQLKEQERHLAYLRDYIDADMDKLERDETIRDALVSKDPMSEMLEQLRAGGVNGIQQTANRLLMAEFVERRIASTEKRAVKFAKEYGPQLWDAASAEAKLDGVKIDEKSK